MTKRSHPTTTSNPRVSVIIPAYNAAPFIASTLESVCSQTFTDYEILIVNDGSPDTAEFEGALAPFLSRVIYLKQRNTGPSGARNHGIREARGEHVAFLDSDDQWLPDFLSTQMRILDGNPAIDLFYCDGLIFGQPPLAGRTLMSASPSRGDVTFDSLIREECTVLTTCTIARRQAVIDAGLFDERFLRSEDFHLWLRMAFRGARIAYNRQVLVRHRRREGSLAHDTVAMIHAFVEVLEDLDARLPLTAAQRALIRRQVAIKQADIALLGSKHLLLAGEYAAAAQALDRACALDPQRWHQTRLRMIRAALRVAPRLLRRTYEALRQPAVPAPAKELS